MDLLDIACYLRWVAYALLIASAVPAGLSIPQFVKSRRGAYYAIRQAALQRAVRRLGIAAAMGVAGIIILIVCPYIAPTGSSPVSTPEATSTPRPTRPPTATPAPQPTATSTPPPSPTLVPSPEVTVLPPDIALTPLPSAVPAGEGARIELTALATEVRRGRPVDPGNVFQPGDHRIYVFFHYEGMQNGVMTIFAWYKDGEFIDFCSNAWLWGMDEDYDFGGETGDSLVYCRLPGGWDSGDYQVHVFIETRLQFVAEFMISGPP